MTNNRLQKLPDFMVVGAQKAATTWLFECLDEHPEIFVPVKKELHFFCNLDDCRFSSKNKGMNWYLSQFDTHKEVKFVGELTTDYMYYEHVAKELYDFNSNLKIVVLLRNPVERAYSAYWMWKRHNKKLPPFGQMIRQPGNSFIRRGLYGQQIKPYLELFGKSRVRMYVLEEIKLSPDKFIEDLYQFIGVNKVFRPRALYKQVAETKNYPGVVGRIVYKGLSPILNARGVRAVWRFIRRKTKAKELVLQILFGSGGKGKYPDMSIDDRNFLAEKFRCENENLAQLLGRNINVW
jgi:hypothetical protein